MRFSADSAVSPDGEGRYVGAVREGWDIAGNSNGGYLLAIAGRAMSDAADGRLPTSITAHYLRPGKVGDVTVETDILKVGRSFSTVTATMLGGPTGEQQKPTLGLIGSFGADDRVFSDAERIDASPVDLPPPEECVSAGGGELSPPFMERLDLRFHPEDSTFDSGTPRFRGWFRWPDDEPIDVFGLLVAVDAMPPTIFNARMPVAWAPTLELTAHIRAQPAPGWLRCVFTTRFISSGFLEEDGEIWDSTGTLVAQSRQLALLPKV